MIVCLCKGLSDKKIRTLIQSGSRSMRDLMSSCQVGGDCGSCIFQVKEMIEQENDAISESNTDAVGS
jgi:bacterioferritin-associated ferredoxin